MKDWFPALLTPPVGVTPAELVLRLGLALVGGAYVAWLHRRTRGEGGVTTFSRTLVLLCVMIAMVTQVIGDNVARAFSLVGALSIVRFRTVLRDTEDTAYVIFSVVTGMAIGAQNLWVAFWGAVAVTIAAVGLEWLAKTPRDEEFELRLRVNLSEEQEGLVAGVLGEVAEKYEMLSATTAQKGMAMDLAWRVRLKKGVTASALVRRLQQTEGVEGPGVTRVE